MRYAVLWGVTAGAALLAPALVVRATPLHGLAAVFQAQTPEAYRQQLAGVVERVESTRLRAGTIDDLRKRLDGRAAPAAPAAKDPAPGRDETPQANRTTGLKLTPTGELQAVTVRDAPGLPVADPRPIRRNLAGQRAAAKRQGEEAVALLQGRMQAFELIEVLAYFNPENVNWDGHMGQNCDYAGFRQTALNGLRQLGDLGADAVVQALGQELTAVTVPREVTGDKVGYAETFNSVYQGQQDNPLTRDRKPVQGAQQLTAEQIVQQTLLMNPTYHGDLLDLLRYFDAQGLLNLETRHHLRTLAAGRKDPEVEPLARAVQGLPAYSSASVADLLRRAPSPAVARELEQRIRSGSVLVLLQIMEGASGQTSAAAAQELARRSPRYAEVRDELADIVKFASSAKPAVAQAAQEQLANAFQRAPIPHALYWLSTNDTKCQALIWQQIDGRIQRADAERRQAYRDEAFRVLGDSRYPLASRRASLQFLVRLRDPLAVDPVIDVLTQLPRELFAEAGQTLRQLTGQDFGPRPGDGVAEVSVAVKHWRQWRQQNRPGPVAK